MTQLDPGRAWKHREFPKLETLQAQVVGVVTACQWWSGADDVSEAVHSFAAPKAQVGR